MKKNLFNYLHFGLKRRMFLLTGIVWLSAFSLAFAQQTITVKGVVYGENNATLPGATIVVKGANIGAVSDINGNFTLKVPANATTLVVSFVGMVSQEVAVSTEPMKIYLVTETTDVGEVVVVGYGVQKKSLVTGAISTIKSDEIRTTSSVRVDQAIQGKTSGVLVLPQGGDPGSTTNIRIRGAGSNQISNPIILVNGMRITNLNSINPNDIGSLEVLKDAASTAIYGAEGANGVIMITLKEGNSTEPQVSYDFQYGIQSFRTKAKMMDATQFKAFQQEAGQTVKDRFNANTNWIDAMFENAPMQQHHLSFSGGNDKTKYLISGGYMNQDGIIGKSSSNYTRYTALINLDSDLKSWLKVGGNFNYMHSNQGGIVSNSEYNSVAGAGLIMDPLTPIVYEGTPPEGGNTMIQDANGKYYSIGENITGEMINPFLSLAVNHNTTSIDQMTGVGYVTLKPIKGLSVTSRLGRDFSYYANHLWQPKFFGSAENQNTSTFVRDNLQINDRWVWDNFASYAKKVGDHSFTALVGYSAQKAHIPNIDPNSGNTQFNTFSMTSGPLVGEGDQYATQAGSTSQANDRIGGYNRESTMASVFGRLSYDYKSKYLLEGSIRRDGASEFPVNNKYGVFPSVSAGWVLTNEDFLKMDALSYLKLRASWGQNGSRSNLTGNSEAELWFLTARYPNDLDQFQSGGWVRAIPNPDLKWETSQQTDIGIDARLLKNKVSITVDYFNKETKDLIATPAPNYSTGNLPSPRNLGTVSNKGVELELGYSNDEHALKYGINANVSFLSNKVTKMNIPTPVDGTGVRNRGLTRFELNQPLWYFRGYKTDGLLKDDAEAATYNQKYGTTFTAGDLKVVDANNDSKIDANDITKIGDPNPNMIYGGNVFVKYMGFDMNVSFQGTQGNDIYMGWFREDRPGSNKPAYFFTDRWTPTNHNASMPKPNNSSLFLYNGDKMIGNGSYLRIKQLQLGYSIPRAIISGTGINALRAYVSLDDYFTITKYEGYDPEVGSNDITLQGLDRGRYPTAAKVIFGLSVNF
ncbi:MAG TPA: TonB-dependent receptor [Prolixibacteraceae bacterium]|jgi:TonB-linked SusC/RagA family outer membrane protein